ncbi:MAG: molybdopterin-synthase adenylyltransferase MoeB [Perlucidibaca sp.]
MLNDEQLLRYNRQILLPDWDVAAQERLLAATVLVVGLGGLGCPLTQYLAAAGVGRLILCDFDQVEITNLQRQVLHHDEDVGRLKVASAADKLRRINPALRIETCAQVVDEAFLARWLPEVDVVADCCDNFATRDAVSRAAWRAGVPLVSAAAIGWQGQLAVFDPRDQGSACYRCLYPAADEDAPTCSEAGVMATTVAVMGAWQAQEVLKVIAGAGRPLTGQLLLWDGQVNEVRRVRTPRDPACPVCSVQGVV